MKKSNIMTVGKIRRELAILIESKKVGLTRECDINRVVDEARKEINIKYGKGWRETYPMTQSYDEAWNEANLDGTFAYNNASDDF